MAISIAHARAATAESALSGKSTAAVEALEAALAKGDIAIDALADRDFAKVPLTKPDAARPRELLWKQHETAISKDREAEVTKGVLKQEKLEILFRSRLSATSRRRGIAFGFQCMAAVAHPSG